MKRTLLAVLCALGLVGLSAMLSTAVVAAADGQVIFSVHVSKKRLKPHKTTLTCSGTFTDTDPNTGQPITITIDVVGFLPHGRR